MPGQHVANQIQARIKEHGYTFIGVFDPDHKDPSFVYTIGLTGQKQAELLLIGNMHPRIIEIILTDLIEEFTRHGFRTGDIPDQIRFKDGSLHPLRVVAVDSREAMNEYAYQVPQYYPRADIRFMQVLWPDAEGIFPGEIGYNESMVQPQLPEIK
jgi:hypothetical protein